VLLAELEVLHSRPIAPTRRVALGQMFLPIRFGGLLLAGMVGACSSRLDDDERDLLDHLLDDVERGRKIIQPRLRYRFQRDTHGLDHSRHRLVGEAEHVELEIDEHGAPLPQILAAVYAAGRLERASRASVFRMLRRATRWQGDADERLLGFLAHGGPRAVGTGDEGWALAVLGFSGLKEPTRSEVNRRFRNLVMDAHPDHGASADDAGRRIVELTEAKRILLAVG
jgi:hypothetical protein